MRIAAMATIVLLLPGSLVGGPTMGVYFADTPSRMEYYPTPFENFAGYIYAHNTMCFLDAVEFALEIPDGIIMLGYTHPAGDLTIGSLPSGLSMALWPPLDGWNPAFNLLCTVNFMAIRSCFYDNRMDLVDAPLRVVAHPDTGLIQGSCWPENNLFTYTGLTSIICPVYIGTGESSWGAIKNLF